MRQKVSCLHGFFIGIFLPKPELYSLIPARRHGILSGNRIYMKDKTVCIKKLVLIGTMGNFRDEDTAEGVSAAG
jgi:hypothetical protein